MNPPLPSRALAALALMLGAGSFPAALAPQVPSALGLAEVYEEVRARNPMLRAARATAGAVASQEGSARLPPDPLLQLGVMNASLPGLSTDMPSSMAPALQVMQMLPFPGKLGLTGRIARLETGMAEEGAEEVWWEARARAAMAFYEIYQTDRQVEVMRETLALLEDFQRVAKAMYAAGDGRQSDVLRAGVEVARMEAEIARMEAMRVSAASRLNALLDRPADRPVPPVTLPPLPLSLPSADTLRAWAEGSRPLLARGSLGVEQARGRTELARREVWPDVSVGVQYGQRPGEMGTERMGSLMIGFSVPVFAGQRQLRMRDEAEAMEQMARWELAAARAMVGSRVEELLAELDRARSLVALYRSEVLPQAAANVSSAFSSYRTGAVDFMTLIDAQMGLNRYRQELIGLVADYGRLGAELEMEIGRELPASKDTLVEDL